MRLTQFNLLSDVAAALLVHVEGSTFGEDSGEGVVQSCQIHLAHSDAQTGGDSSTQEFAVGARVGRGWWQFVPSQSSALGADLPDVVGRGLVAEPDLQHVAQAMAALPVGQCQSCAFRFLPEAHETGVGIAYVDVHGFRRGRISSCIQSSFGIARSPRRGRCTCGRPMCEVSIHRHPVGLGSCASGGIAAC